jgi:hypothetical protein
MMILHNVRQELTIKRQKSKCHGGIYRRFIASGFIEQILFILIFKGKQRGRISIIYYSILNPINPTLQPAVSAELI